MKLTIKQEKFAQKFVECGNASEAYRHAYNTENMLDKTVWERASVELAKSKVSARVGELKAKLVEKHEVTMDYVTQILKDALEIAYTEKDGKLIKDVGMDMSKLYGLIQDRSQAPTIINVDDRQDLIAQRFVERANEQTKH